MTPRDAAGLLMLARALPAEVPIPIPAGWVVGWLEGTSPVPEASTVAPADLTCAELAQRFGRAISTIRGWCERGLLVGAYRFRGTREWRIPPAALSAFEAVERARGRDGLAASLRTGRPVDLSAWRAGRPA